MLFDCLALHSSPDLAVRVQTYTHNIYFSFYFILREVCLPLFDFRLWFQFLHCDFWEDSHSVCASNLAVSYWVQEAFSFTHHIYWAPKLIGCFWIRMFLFMHGNRWKHSTSNYLKEKVFRCWVCLCILLEHV